MQTPGRIGLVMREDNWEHFQKFNNIHSKKQKGPNPLKNKFLEGNPGRFGEWLRSFLLFTTISLCEVIQLEFIQGDNLSTYNSYI